jgi:quercetin dioxygenase-like cupin family protein
VQYLEMPPRLIMPEHPHPWESIVYTIRGHWVLCAGGNRSTMQPGSILWLRRGVSSAFEVPYPEPALILVFKPVQDEPDDAGFRYCRERVGRKVDKRSEDRQKFDLGFLPPDHPAYVLE